MKDNFWKWMVILLAGINIILLGTFWMGKKPHKPSMHSPKEFIEKELQLNPEQAKVFHELHKKHMDDTKALHDRIKSLRKDILNHNDQKKGNQNLMDSLYSELGNTHIALEKSINDHYDKLRLTLSEDQSKILRDLLSKPPKLPPRKGPHPKN